MCIRRFMILTIMLGFGVMFLLMPPPLLEAQQKEAPALVQVQGLEEVTATLRRIEGNLAQLLTSRWEYRFVQRNRLDQLNAVVPNELESLGRDGWELVNVTVQEGFLLKRRVRR